MSFSIFSIHQFLSKTFLWLSSSLRLCISCMYTRFQILNMYEIKVKYDMNHGKIIGRSKKFYGSGGGGAWACMGVVRKYWGSIDLPDRGCFWPQDLTPCPKKPYSRYPNCQQEERIASDAKRPPRLFLTSAMNSSTPITYESIPILP